MIPTHLPLTLLRPSRQQPRTRFTPARMAELADSIRTHGVLQPLLVRPAPDWTAGEPTHEIVAGERRWRAAQAAGLTEVPVLLRELSDADVAEIQLAENIDREDLHPLEEARHLQRLLDSREGPDQHPRYPTHRELAARLGRSEAWIGRRLALCSLTDEAASAFLADRIPTATAQVLARLASPEQQAEALAHVLQGWAGEPLSAAATAEWVKKKYLLRLATAPFSIDAAYTHAGPCATCPKRSGARPDLFDDLAGADHCLDAACWDAKHDAHVDALLVAAQELGQTVLEGAKARDFMPSPKVPPSGHHWLNKACPKLTDSKRPLSELMAKNKAVVVVDHPDADLPLYLVPEAAAKKALKKAGKLREEAAAPEPAPAAAASALEPVPAWPFPQKATAAQTAPAAPSKAISLTERAALLEAHAGLLFSRALLSSIGTSINSGAGLPLAGVLRFALADRLADHLSAEGCALLYVAMGWPAPEHGVQYHADLTRRFDAAQPAELMLALGYAHIVEELADEAPLPDLDQLGDSRALAVAEHLDVPIDQLWAQALEDAETAAKQAQRDAEGTTTATGAVLAAHGEGASA